MTREPSARSRALASSILAASTLVVGGCGRKSEPELPGAGTAPEAALAFVAAASGTDPRDLLRHVDADALQRDGAGLLHAAAALAGWAAPRVVEESVLDEERTAVDVEADLPGGGLVRGSFVVFRGSDGRFRVAAVFAPGVEWPRREPPPQEGLSVSPAPR